MLRSSNITSTFNNFENVLETKCKAPHQLRVQFSVWLCTSSLLPSHTPSDSLPSIPPSLSQEDASYTLRKGLEKAFPGLASLGGEKRGQKYISRKFQAPTQGGSSVAHTPSNSLPSLRRMLRTLLKGLCFSHSKESVVWKKRV